MAKIIAKTNGGFLVEFTEHEVANLSGYYSHYNYPRHHKPVAVGQELRIAEMYEWLTSLAGLESKLQQARGILTTVAGGLTMVDPLVREIAQVTGKKEEQS